MAVHKTTLFILAALLAVTVVAMELSLAVFWADVVGATDKAATPGIGITYLAAIDLVLAFQLAMWALGAMAPAVQGRLHAPVGLILGLFGALGAILALILAIIMLTTMVSLLLAIPFGTAVYMALYGTFPKADAAVTLGILMLLKLVTAGMLFIANPRLLGLVSLVLLLACSLGGTWLVAMLHALLPGFLAAIGDAIGAIVVAIIGVIWLLVVFINAIPSVLAQITGTLKKVI